MRPIKQNRYVNRVMFSDDEKLFLLKNSKLMPLSELSEKLGRTEKQIKDKCARIGCGYFSSQQHQAN